ncbi:MAG: SDR family oxidoreductase [Phycisphaerales bacterium]|nr:SDR family oxidoreductase [Phycisphaerales bacterium]
MNHTKQSPVAMVTGAGSGIGRAVAIGLGAQGYSVILVGRKLENLEETGQIIWQQHRSDSHPVSIDITSTNERNWLIDEIYAAYGRLDALVNCAGIGTCKAIGELSEAEILELFKVNAIGPIELARLALPELIKSKGCVINVASMAIVDPFVGLGIYGCTKAALDGLTRALHNEYSEQGVRAYTVAPGAVETEMLRSIVSTDLLPTDQTLSPEQVAGKIIACITGDVAEASGSTILLKSS